MTAAQRAAVKLSETRSAINVLLGADRTDTQNAELRELTVKAIQQEEEWRATTVAGEDPEIRTVDEADDSETRERRNLRRKTNIADYLQAAISGNDRERGRSHLSSVSDARKGEGCRSPRVRGVQRIDGTHAGNTGCIPAKAGQIVTSSLACFQAGVHPHIYGERAVRPLRVRVIRVYPRPRGAGCLWCRRSSSDRRCISARAGAACHLLNRIPCPSFPQSVRGES